MTKQELAIILRNKEEELERCNIAIENHRKKIEQYYEVEIKNCGLSPIEEEFYDYEICMLFLEQKIRFKTFNEINEIKAQLNAT